MIYNIYIIYRMHIYIYIYECIYIYMHMNVLKTMVLIPASNSHLIHHAGLRFRNGARKSASPRRRKFWFTFLSLFDSVSCLYCFFPLLMIGTCDYYPFLYCLCAVLVPLPMLLFPTHFFVPCYFFVPSLIFWSLAHAFVAFLMFLSDGLRLSIERSNGHSCCFYYVRRKSGVCNRTSCC